MPTHQRPVVVVGAGPYGLAAAAHLAARGAALRVFGEPMAGWRDHMPAGMFLKSTPRASNISAPTAGHRLADYRAARGLPPVGDRYPVPIAEFIAYGAWFQQARVPEVERCSVLGIEYDHGVFRLRLDTGEEVLGRAVVLATGLRAFAHAPAVLTAVRQAGLASHTSDHPDLGRFAGRRVAVIGAGQSALESAALLAEAGARPTLLARTARLRFGDTPETDLPGERPAPVRARYPGSELGPGWHLLGYCRAPWAFRHLPDDARARRVRTVLGPAGAWWLRERVEDGAVPLLTGCSVESARERAGTVRLRLRLPGRTDELEADHVLAATGYRVDVERLGVLDEGLRRAVRRTPDGAPRLSGAFESSVPGLYFTGLSAANSFGPLLRFVCGTDFAARRISTALTDGARD
ncbi:FAD-dependent oxidoreductase [Kitasatospora sp. NPDC058218]|uniref:FAD-dependent oxidoreductase n=1 Tax=Kitasatospora sp. NPDC058218 TaxID=3346385 RepID=UPI0036DB2DC7